ncbi:hypothetical protein ANANG_G00183620 [Anguilla anguilla]|uniref:protein-tyrosine-phosphatase n=1 Tax=Anguilla anguilla TaxID=7936 RepID=A0A9D3RTK8_ANGAN|nr:hypothetical protein ANANG_G00183620 [Anguilla anguilla]
MGGCGLSEQSVPQEDEHTPCSFMAARAGHAHSELRSSVVNESSSLLGGSPLRACGRKGSPYHTGQLHPAVRVADLLQHINQMKTAEGYGFKQEYESFFEGWDIAKKKEKPKGKHGGLLGCDRHRVKLNSLLSSPASEYVNANYIDGYQRSNHFIATQGPRPDMLYDFWRMVWQENCYSIVMITKLAEVGRVNEKLQVLAGRQRGVRRHQDQPAEDRDAGGVHRALLQPGEAGLRGQARGAAVPLHGLAGARRPRPRHGAAGLPPPREELHARRRRPRGGPLQRRGWQDRLLHRSGRDAGHGGVRGRGRHLQLRQDPLLATHQHDPDRGAVCFHPRRPAGGLSVWGDVRPAVRVRPHVQGDADGGAPE